MPAPPDTYLSKRGYGFVKTECPSLVEELREKLTVKPFISPSSPSHGSAREFAVYCESNKKIYIPKAYGLLHFGMPKHDQLTDGNPAPGLVFHGTLRPEQDAPVACFLEAARDPLLRGGIISMRCAAGKCLARNTPVLMHDGTIKMAQEVLVGDQLMGDDSTPRTVLSTCSGEEELFDILPARGDKYTVNRSHILSLKCAKTGTVVDISVDDYLTLENRGSLCGYRVGVEFPEREVPLDPYVVGYWLGDGSYRHDHKRIPHLYKCNSRRVRMELLAGILDAVHVRGPEITIKSEKFTDDVIYLARSLGFAAYKKLCIVEDATIDTCYSTRITGKGMEQVPTRVRPMRAEPHAWDALMTGIRVVPNRVGKYYGFEIDGNRRFLLGDFTVTHNTVMALNIACHLGRKTLVICHKSFLLNQWRERIQQFIPTAQVGIIQQDRMVVDGCDIVLASLQSLAMRDYPPHLFDGIHTTIIDEVHHTSAEVFSRALPKVTAPVMLGLSATLKRADGLSKVFEWYIGKPVFVSKKRDVPTCVMMLPYNSEDPEYGKEIRIWTGKLNVAQMITRVCSFAPRNTFIMDTLSRVLQEEPGRRALVLSDRRDHLATLERMIRQRGIGTVGYYVGGMKEEDLKESEGKDIILGTFAMACLADDTLVIDPITGKEHYLRDFETMTPDTVSIVSFQYGTGTFHVSRPSRFGRSPPKPCVRIIHELGDITVSTDHKVCTTNGWRFAGELTTADFLVAPARLDMESDDIVGINCADLWVLGCFLGSNTSGRVPCEEVHKQIMEVMKGSSIHAHLCISLEQKRSQECGQYNVSSDLMHLPEGKICSLVGGIFETAGDVCGCDLSFTLNSLQLVNQVRTLLLRLRIRSVRTSCVKPGYSYTIRVLQDDVPLFVSVMDVRGSAKQEALKAARAIIREFMDVIPKPKAISPMMAPVRICSIDPVNPDEVKLCDIEVPVHHSFLASDIIVHNSEGMDIPALNTLVLASPVSSIEQAVGRIQRQQAQAQELTPLVLDIWDQFSLFKAQGFRRLQYYKKSRYEMKTA